MDKVKNAIILAAGRGSRLKDLTKNTPKPLLKIDEKSFIENIIEKLIEKNITKIFVVVGYLGEQFQFLKKQYGVQLIVNKEWNQGNNVTSLKAAIKHLGDSLIVNGDIVLKENVFQDKFASSLTYVNQDENIDEWIVNLNDDHQVLSIDKEGLGKKGFYQREIVFVNEELSKAVKKEIEFFDMNEYQEFLLLEASKKYEIPFSVFEIPKDSVYDLDHKDDFLKYKNV